MSDFDFDDVFGDDYMHFYRHVLTDEVSDRQAQVTARLLDLQPGMRVLDCPCGFGRIATRLAARGARVIGIDATPAFIELAKEQKDGVDYRVGDMRELAFDAELDAVVNVFTSFGYFDEATDRDVLKRFRRALKPGGKLVIEHLSAHRMLSILGAQGGQSDHYVEAGDDLLVDRTTYDPLTGRLNTQRTSVRDGRVHRYRFSTRLFTPAELGEWLRAAGFDSVAAFDQDGNPFSLAARRMYVVAS